MVKDVKDSIVPYDSIIVGAGPSGITAAIYLARKKLDILVVTLDIGGQAGLTTDIENYTGFTMVHGQELVNRFEDHLKTFNIKVVFDKVTAIKKENELFRIETTKSTYWAKSVIVATGKRPRMLNVPGEEKYIGRGVTYYTVYDSPYFKNRPVAVIGGGNSALQAVLELANFTNQIYVINKEKELKGDEVLQERVKNLGFVKVFNSCIITRIKGRTTVDYIEVENVATKEKFELRVDGVVITAGLESSLDFELPKGLNINEKGEIDVDQNCCTNIPGFFAAGDVTDVKWKQIIIAAGEGAKAALSAYEYLRSLR